MIPAFVVLPTGIILLVATLVLKLTGDPEKDRAFIERGASIIRGGGLVAFPTETVYGLGANAFDAAAVRRIFEAKERPEWDPLIVHVCSLEMFRLLVEAFPPLFEVLVHRFMPGPLTLVLPRSDRVPDEVTAKRSTIAVRMPAHPVALALIEASGVPIAAPSANRFGKPSPTTAEHVLRDLGGRIEALLDAGPTPIGVESTILDLSQQPPQILRPGGIPKEALEAVLGQVVLSSEPIPSTDSGLPAPGMSPRHYAPKARLIPIEGGASELTIALLEHLAKGNRIGVLLPTDWQLPIGKEGGLPFLSFDWGPWGDWETLAKRLFNGLRWLDDQGVDLILCPLPPPEALGLAIRDRLLRAARPPEKD